MRHCDGELQWLSQLPTRLPGLHNHLPSLESRYITQRVTQKKKLVQGTTSREVEDRQAVVVELSSTT